MSDSDKKSGLYRKYFARRVNDITHKHDDCFLFVLDLDHDAFAIPAIKAYIEACREEYPLLAEDLNNAVLARPIR